MHENEAENLTEMEKIMDERLEQEKKDIIAMLDKATAEQLYIILRVVRDITRWTEYAKTSPRRLIVLG